MAGWLRRRRLMGGVKAVCRIRDAVEDVMEVLATPADRMSEVRAREGACLPGSEV